MNVQRPSCLLAYVDITSTVGIIRSAALFFVLIFPDFPRMCDQDPPLEGV